jgi:DNA-3-methyladenine glycosylase I
MMSGAVPGPDGLLRCPWALSAREYLAYHDHEWGKPVSTVQGLYERMTLEAFQSGLSWITILRKRENFRRAFAGFWPERVAAFTTGDIERLLSDPGIVRNRAKIAAAIENARLVVDFGSRFAEIVLSYRVIGRPRPVAGEWRATSPESVAMARELKDLGFRFIGPTTAYATMQAIGLVDDHVVGCFAPPPAWRRRIRPQKHVPCQNPSPVATR